MVRERGEDRHDRLSREAHKAPVRPSGITLYSDGSLGMDADAWVRRQNQRAEDEELRQQKPPEIPIFIPRKRNRSNPPQT